ncbi:hypothetical protein V8F33_012506 [Rhypophila sp. PSN 637]
MELGLHIRILLALFTQVSQTHAIMWHHLSSVWHPDYRIVKPKVAYFLFGDSRSTDFDYTRPSDLPSLFQLARMTFCIGSTSCYPPVVSLFHESHDEAVLELVAAGETLSHGQ